jgi:thymidylate synthase (FAD)
VKLLVGLYHPLEGNIVYNNVSYQDLDIEQFRHQIGFARNEVSRRYVDSVPECWIPNVSDLRERDPNLKQGSRTDSIDQAELVQRVIKDHTEGCISLYQYLLEQKVAPEIARCVLPQSMITEFIETGSLAAYSRLYKLRNDPHAQKEIRDIATKVGELMEAHFPISWKALTSA